MRIDHVILATGDLDGTEQRLADAFGLHAAGGGRHDGLGTHNRIVPLGGGYLELLAVADAGEAAGSDLGRAVTRFVAERGTGLMAWAVAVGDISAVAGRLGTDVTTISRAGLAAKLTGVAAAMADPVLPFFIERDGASADPGVGSDAGGITSIELAGDGPRLADWLGGADLPVELRRGPSAVRSVRVGAGELRWPPEP